MKRYAAQIRHTYATILRMSRVQYDTFEFKSKLLMLVAGFGLALAGMANMESVFGILLLMIGCWLLASLNYPAKQNADRIKDALGGQYPSNRYEFFDKHFVLYAQNEDIVNYSRLIRLVEDEQYCYLFIDEQASYMLEKYSLGDELKAFMAFMEKATGLSWTKPYRLSTLNLKSLIRIYGPGEEKKGKKKKK